ncbi:MAG: type II secretion system protein GspM [Myxococcota bacterium]
MTADLIASMRSAYENLNDREQKLVGLLGAVALALLVMLPVLLVLRSMGQLEEENRQLASVLRDLDRSRTHLEAQQARAEASKQRYAQSAPALRQLVATLGEEVGLQVRETTPQPERVSGGFKRRHLRVSLPRVGLRPSIELMAHIDNSAYPVALKRIQIEHFRSGDSYNMQLDVISYEHATDTSESRNR